MAQQVRGHQTNRSFRPEIAACFRRFTSLVSFSEDSCLPAERRASEVRVGSADAASITLFNTDVDVAGGADGLDDNYALTSAPGGATGAYLLTPIPAVWYSSSGTWIGVNNADACFGSLVCDNDPVGDYDFTLLFDLTGLDPSTATISGSWATDNGGKILLNGVEVASQPSNAYGSLAAFSITSDFVAGVNTLTFRVNNDDCGGTDGGCPGQGGTIGNPVGLLVTNMRGEAAVPEPAVLALLGGGLLAVGRRYRRRRTVV